MNAEEFTDALEDLLDDLPSDCWWAEQVKNVRTFAEVGVLTQDKGLVVRLRAGEEFQVTIVRSMRAS